MSALEPGIRVRCVFGSGVVESVDLPNRKVWIKFDNGSKQLLNIQEVERVTAASQPKAVVKTVTTTTTTSSGGTTTVSKTEKLT